MNVFIAVKGTMCLIKRMIVSSGSITSVGEERANFSAVVYL